MIEIVKGFYETFGIPLIRGNQTADRPGYPYISYNVLSTASDMNYNLTVEPLLDGVRETRKNEVIQTVSFTSYSDDYAEAKDVTDKLYRYLKVVGYEYLSKNDVIVVEVLNVENREILEVDAYSYRFGFDARIRYNEVVEVDSETIDSYSIEGGKQ